MLDEAVQAYIVEKAKEGSKPREIRDLLYSERKISVTTRGIRKIIQKVKERGYVGRKKTPPRKGIFSTVEIAFIFFLPWLDGIELHMFTPAWWSASHVCQPSARSACNGGNLDSGIVNDLEGKAVQNGIGQQLCSEKLNEEVIAFVYCGLLKLIKLALRIPQTSLKQEVFKEDLLELQVPQEFVIDIASVVFGNRRPGIDECLENGTPSLSRIDNFRWRVDVGISTGVLNRVLVPSVLLEMKMNDGTIQQFEVSATKFHELRHSVASVLKDMRDLERRNILKIQD